MDIDINPSYPFTHGHSSDLSFHHVSKQVKRGAHEQVSWTSLQMSKQEEVERQSSKQYKMAGESVRQVSRITGAHAESIFFLSQ